MIARDPRVKAEREASRRAAQAASKERLKKQGLKRRDGTPVFEEVVEYLFVEGFADTIENAEVMAENISEQWIDEILNEMEVQPPKEPLKTDRNMFNIPADEKEAARERTLAKAKAMRAKKGL